MTLEGASTVVCDRALSLGLFGGLLTSVAGLGGYIVVPVLTGEEHYLINAAMSAGFDILWLPLWYHGVVLLLPSFVASLAGTLLVRRWGLTGNAPVLKLVGGIVCVPIAALLATYFVTAVSFGVSASIPMAEESLIYAVLGLFGLTALALGFGLIALVFAMAVVVPGVVLGVAGGYLLARGLIRLGEDSSSDR